MAESAAVEERIILKTKDDMFAILPRQSIRKRLTNHGDLQLAGTPNKP